MRTRCFLSLFCTTALLASCGSKGRVSSVRPVFISSAELDRIFAKHRVEGSLMILEVGARDGGQEADRGRFRLLYNPKGLDRRFIPASTFKIPNALIALETKAIRDEREVIPWDKVKRFSMDWNRDQNLCSAIRVSAVWAFQILARRIGQKRMQEFVDRIGYGNRDTSGGVDLFWLSGGLAISPREQIGFLKRLYQGTLPFSRRSMDTVKRCVVVERTPSYVMRAKTGTVMRKGALVGWYVGWLERDGRAFLFALNARLPRWEQGRDRRALIKEVFHRLGLRR